VQKSFASYSFMKEESNQGPINEFGAIQSDGI
jgi:hypothetical protein